jgi:hypothetical protein
MTKQCEQRPAHVLYGRLNGRRVAVYVPEELVPEVRRGVENGHALQELLQRAAPRYVKALWTLEHLSGRATRQPDATIASGALGSARRRARVLAPLADPKPLPGLQNGGHMAIPPGN